MLDFLDDYKYTHFIRQCKGLANLFCDRCVFEPLWK